MTRRQSNTGADMVNSGQWVKVGRKHYRHVSGTEITYNNNRWLCEISGMSEAYTLLWVARHWVELKAVA